MSPHPVPSDLVVPRYGERSLAEVVPALLAALGVPRTAHGRTALTVPPVRAAGLLLVDALGSDLLRRHAADAPFLAGLPDIGPLTAGFPSSTATSLTSLGTGTPPGTHGIVGITMRVGSARRPALLHTLHWTDARTNPPADLRESFPPEGIQPGPTALERAAGACVAVTVVSARRFKNSGLTRAALRGGEFRGVTALGDLAAEMVTALRGPGLRLVYGYHADLDALGHEYGPGSLPWRMQLAAMDRVAASIAENLPSDAVLAVTGDHGMVTVDRRVDADTHPDLQRDVALLGGDPRSRLVYARRGAAADVLATWRGVLGDAALVVSGEEAVAQGWFGPASKRVADRIGDVVVVARGGTAIVRSAAEPGLSVLPGQHGALSAEEQWVPLLLARTP
jgi:Type I phosphodiesterase / nucleotide pyrophosphatase